LSEGKNKFDEIFTEKHTLNLKSAKLYSDNKQKNLSIKQNSSATFTTAFGLSLRGIFIDEL